MALKGKDDPAADMERRIAQDELDEAKEVMEQLSTLYQDVLSHCGTSWDHLDSRSSRFRQDEKRGWHPETPKRTVNAVPPTDWQVVSIGLTLGRPLNVER